MGKKKEANQLKKLFAGIKQKVRAAKIEAAQIRAKCPHKSRGGTLWLKKHKKGSEKTTFKCKECGRKIDMTPIIDKTPKELKRYTRQVTNDFVNLCNIAKVTLSPKLDGKYIKVLSNGEFYAYQVRKLAKVTLSAVSNKKGHRRGKKGRRNVIFGGRAGGLH